MKKTKLILLGSILPSVIATGVISVSCGETEVKKNDKVESKPVEKTENNETTPEAKPATPTPETEKPAVTSQPLAEETTAPVSNPEPVQPEATVKPAPAVETPAENPSNEPQPANETPSQPEVVKPAPVESPTPAKNLPAVSSDSSDKLIKESEELLKETEFLDMFNSLDKLKENLSALKSDKTNGNKSAALSLEKSKLSEFLLNKKLQKYYGTELNISLNRAQEILKADLAKEVDEKTVNDLKDLIKKTSEHVKNKYSIDKDKLAEASKNLKSSIKNFEDILAGKAVDEIKVEIDEIIKKYDDLIALEVVTENVKDEADLNDLKKTSTDAKAYKTENESEANTIDKILKLKSKIKADLIKALADKVKEILKTELEKLDTYISVIKAIDPTRRSSETLLNTLENDLKGTVLKTVTLENSEKDKEVVERIFAVKKGFVDIEAQVEHQLPLAVQYAVNKIGELLLDKDEEEKALKDQVVAYKKGDEDKTTVVYEKYKEFFAKFAELQKTRPTRAFTKMIDTLFKNYGELLKIQAIKDYYGQEVVNGLNKLYETTKKDYESLKTTLDSAEKARAKRIEYTNTLKSSLTEALMQDVANYKKDATFYVQILKMLNPQRDKESFTTMQDLLENDVLARFDKLNIAFSDVSSDTASIGMFVAALELMKERTPQLEGLFKGFFQGAIRGLEKGINTDVEEGKSLADQVKSYEAQEVDKSKDVYLKYLEFAEKADKYPKPAE
ncbi:hypothetical protein [Mycoplasma sp. Ms02]|uniref:hypothetical protein n=1 Tax=Mycoplasma sp. Ms02 TaxID=353851 RepID=UPI001C8B07AA|nr:hypothetical protein [Mycoplasma sp. Ms02]QZE12429.1 hypothetical protein K4L35_00340 [Mycoplasma sp. Ms02]